MNELEDIKARASERRRPQPGPDEGLTLVQSWEEAEADLDRAIAIADAAAHCSCFSRMTVVRTTKELAIVPANIKHDRFRDELNRLTEVRCTLCGTMFYVATFDELYQERDEAITAVLKLREFISSSDIRYTPAIEKMLTETESYEQYR